MASVNNGPRTSCVIVMIGACLKPFFLQLRPRATSRAQFDFTVVILRALSIETL